MKFIRKYLPLIFILGVSGIYLFSRLGRDMLNDWDECIYAAYTHSMKAGGNYLVNTFNGPLVFDKPPLYMWILSIATAFHESEFAFRFFSVVAALALVAAIYIFTQKHFSKKAAILASLLILSSQSIVSHF
ncbi:glycosyltransferase family 39 protein [Candidatus Microgenomates bacterium]|nr:glycosyltransferase family 39 protein [Candidatus Microgenomates bacterium]